MLNGASRVTILAGAGCAGAHHELMQLAAALKAPIVHAFRGKDQVEPDNPYDVGMTGLIGVSSGYRAMEHCDTLLMLGTDFPYRPFLPAGVPVIQVDVRGENIGRRVAVDVPVVGTVRDTVAGLLPLLVPKTDAAHLDRMTAHYARARRQLAGLPATTARTQNCIRSSSPTPSTGSRRRTRSSPRTSALRASGPLVTST